MLIKLSAACLAACGAKTADEFPDKLVAMLKDASESAIAISEMKNRIVAAEKSITETKSDLEAANKTITSQAEKLALQEQKLGNPSTVTEPRLISLATETAKVEASRVAVEQIGSIGGAPATAAAVNVPAKTEAQAKSFPDLVAAHCATGKTKADATLAAIKEAPAVHAEWLKTGGGKL